MVARTLAVLFIISAVITLGWLAALPMTRSAANAASEDHGHQQPAPRSIRTPAARVLILGNVITAAVYLVLYGFAAGAFN